jgi:hypothetical protein
MLKTVLHQKDIYIPTACSAFVSGISLVFYAMLVQTVSTNLSAAYIATTSLASIIQIAFVPQAWIYVFGAHEASERRLRYNSSVRLEVCGGLAGLLVVFPLVCISKYGIAILLAYCALILGGSTAVQGYVRGQGHWTLYSLYVTLPSLLRVLTVTAAVWHKTALVNTLPQMIMLYFLFPEIVRYLLINTPFTIATWQKASTELLRQTGRQLFRNWLYDIGSATTEVADKYLISLIVSPALLVVYFFERKMSSAVTIVLEPMYSSKYRKLCAQADRSDERRSLTRPLRYGYMIAAGICLTVLGIIKLLTLVSFGHIAIIPPILRDNMLLFVVCLLIDAAIAANRWGRYISIMNGTAVLLLIARWVCFAVFMTVAFAFSFWHEAIGLATGFFCYALLELLYVSRSARRTKAAAALC